MRNCEIEKLSAFVPIASSSGLIFTTNDSQLTIHGAMYSTNPENILILCPNHHRIIRNADAIYYKVNRVYQFNKKVIEGINFG